MRLLALWFAAAVVIGLSGGISVLKPPAPQIVLASLTLLLVGSYYKAPAMRAWADSLRLRSMLAFHLTRLVGLYFLYLYGRGELPYDFAVKGGIGDVLVAASAVALIFTGDPSSDLRQRLYLIWNTLGLVDILFVVATAARLSLGDPGSMRMLLQFPLNLLITFLVPLIIASHLLVFKKLKTL